MPNRPQYQPDRRGLAKFLRSAELGRAVRVRAEQAAVLARLRLPKETGTLRASVTVTSTELTVSGDRRVAAVVVVSAPYSAAVEFGVRGGRRGRHVMSTVAESLSPRRRRI